MGTFSLSSPNPPEGPAGRRQVLGYWLEAVTLEEAARWCLARTRGDAPALLVTLNPEIVIRAEADAELKEALLRADYTVADGVGILWASRRQGQNLPERVPGVELAARLLELGGAELGVYFLGGKPGVAERAAEAAQARFGTRVCGARHGYFAPNDEAGIVQDIAASGARLLLAGLGERQELWLDRHKDALGVPLLIGVGGTLDVLAGEARRTPAWTRRLGLEWAYRVGADPKRWHRFPRLMAFVRLALRARDGGPGPSG